VLVSVITFAPLPMFVNVKEGFAPLPMFVNVKEGDARQEVTLNLPLCL
jgi:hypothetical protein